MTKLARVFLLSLTLFFPLVALSGARPDTADYIPARRFADVAVAEINQAKSSVSLFLYLFAYRPAHVDSGPARLARALVEARKRGVDVEVTLNGFFDAEMRDDGNALNESAAAFLRAGGVRVFMSTGPTLHAKTLVVDRKTALLGSSNWTATALDKNFEGNALLRSPSAAEGALRDFARLPRREAAPADGEVVLLPGGFFQGPLDRMVSRGDRYAFDAYLRLLRMGRVGGPAFVVERAAFARALGFPAREKRKENFQIRRLLEKLQADGVIRVEQRERADPLVSLADLPGEPFPFPAAYLDLGWDRRLGLDAKIFYLIALRERAVSPLFPSWSADRETIRARYGLGLNFISNGVMELRRAGLLEVAYSPYVEGEARQANIYTVRPFYDPAALEARFAALEKTHGAAALKRGREIAGLVYEDSNAATIERIILYEKKYGRARMERALRIIGEKKPDNPKRNAGYLLGILDGVDWAESGSSAEPLSKTGE